MHFEWMKIVFAALFEVLWVIGLKHADGFLEWSGTLIAIGISFYFLIMAGEKLPAGTVYAVFTGLGTAGTVLVGWLVFGEPMDFLKAVLLLLLCIGVLGLKSTTDHVKKEGNI